MKKIVFINRYYAPDHSATSQLLTQLSENLTLSGKDIHVIASRQLYQSPKAELPNKEVINGVNIHRVYTTKFGRANLLGRSIDYASFYFFSFICLLRILDNQSLVVAKTDPPLISVVTALVVKLKGAIFFNWIQDLFPEVANAIKPGMIPEPIYRLLIKIRNWSLRQANKNIVIGESMREKIIFNGIDSSKIEVINNWFVSNNSDLSSDKTECLKKEWGVSDKIVIGYSGNLGRAHDCTVILDAARRLLHNQRIVFLFIGGGSGMDALKKSASKENLKNIIFKSYQPLSELNMTLSIPDIHLVSLKKMLEGLIVPSKLYGILAVGRPVIFLGDRNGEVAKIIRRFNCGVALDDNDVNGIVSLIEKFSKSDISYDEREIRGVSRRNYHFDNVLHEWEQIIKKELSVSRSI